MDLNMRYTVTVDGVRIAHGTAGQGRPLLRIPNPPFVHSQAQWRQGTFYDRLCRNRLVVTFDPRGTGMSERDVEDFSLEARLLDVDAVVDHLGLEAFALNGTWFSGALAITYATRHPERVTHLVLDDAFADCGAAIQSSQIRALRELNDNWEEQTEMMAFAFAGVGGEEARRYAEFMRSSTTQENFNRMVEAFGLVDVTDVLPLVQAPTIIMQHTGFRGYEADGARKMATLIPNARLVMLDGKEGDDLDHVLRAMAEFLGDDYDAGTPEQSPQPSAFRTVLFTDLVGHTEMMSRLGDERGRDLLREHERITRKVLKANGGTEVKTMGDGFMASFGSVTKAVECAIALQKAIEAGNQDSESPLARAAGEGKGVRVRVGLNAGKPIEEDGDLFGATVILASRIAAKADGGEILVADTVRGLCSGKGFLFGDRGEFVAKGFEEPTRVSEVSWRE